MRQNLILLVISSFLSLNVFCQCRQEKQEAPRKNFSGRCTVFQPHCAKHYYDGCCFQCNPGFYNNRIWEGAGIGSTTGNGNYYENFNEPSEYDEYWLPF